MRVIAGEFKGRPINAPEGQGTRPTIDRVRESLFSALYSLRGGLEGAQVLDAFAGSGALGIEALSRGAERAVFYESDPKAAKIVEGNLKALGVDNRRGVLRRADVIDSPPVSVRPAFDLILLDPPYAMEASAIGAFVDRLDKTGAVADGAIVSYEHALKDDPMPFLDALEETWYHVSTRKYGKVAVSTFCKEE